jgi:hypothetical protein
MDRPVADPRPTTPQAGRAGALPIPADYVYVKLNLKAARGTALYKQFEAQIKDAMTKAMAKDNKGIAKALIETCKLDPTTTIDEVVLAMALGKSTEKGDAIAVISGSFDGAKLMACVKPELEKAEVTFKDVTIGGKKGMQMKGKEGKENTVVELGGNTFALANGENQAKMAAVLEGKSPSIEDAPLYKQTLGLGNADTILTVIVPTIPESLTAAAPMPFLKEIKAANMLIGLPAGGIDLKAGLDMGENEKAEKLAKSIPLLIGVVKGKLPGGIGETVAEALKVKAEGGWVKVGLALDKAAFDKLLKVAQEMLGGALKDKLGGAGADPADMAADKPAAKADDKPAAKAGDKPAAKADDK